MSKLQFIFVLVIIPTFLFSQITINQSDMPSDGDTIRTSTSVDVGLINFEETGVNFTWDFSNMIPISQTVDTFVSVAETPWLYQLIFFSSSNLAKKLLEFDQYPGFQLTDTYEYYKNSSSDFRLVGNAVTISGIPLPNKFQDPDIIYKFPLNYGNTDSSLSSYEISIPGIGYSSGTKKRVNHADGWGTLITPYGSFPAIRVKSFIRQFDSLYIDSLGIGFPVTREYYEYKWLGDGFGIPLCQIKDDGLLPTISYIDSVRSLFVGEKELTLTDRQVEVYPNPSNGEFHIRMKDQTVSPVTLSLLSLNGKLILRKEIQPVTTINIKHYQIPGGVYILKIETGNQVYHQRVIIR